MNINLIIGNINLRNAFAIDSLHFVAYCFVHSADYFLKLSNSRKVPQTGYQRIVRQNGDRAAFSQPSNTHTLVQPTEKYCLFRTNIIGPLSTSSLLRRRRLSIYFSSGVYGAFMLSLKAGLPLHVRSVVPKIRLSVFTEVMIFVRIPGYTAILGPQQSLASVSHPLLILDPLPNRRRTS